MANLIENKSKLKSQKTGSNFFVSQVIRLAKFKKQKAKVINFLNQKSFQMIKRDCITPPKEILLSQSINLKEFGKQTKKQVFFNLFKKNIKQHIIVKNRENSKKKMQKQVKIMSQKFQKDIQPRNLMINEVFLDIVEKQHEKCIKIKVKKQKPIKVNYFHQFKPKQQEFKQQKIRPLSEIKLDDRQKINNNIFYNFVKIKTSRQADVKPEQNFKKPLDKQLDRQLDFIQKTSFDISKQIYSIKYRTDFIAPQSCRYSQKTQIQKNAYAIKDNFLTKTSIKKNNFNQKLKI